MPDKIDLPHATGLALEALSTVLVPSFYKYLQAQTAQDQKAGREGFVEAIREVVESWFVVGKVWARGEEFGWVDAAFPPWVARLPLLTAHRAFKIEQVGSERFERWVEAVKGRDSVRQTSSPPESYASVYDRYLTDTAESEVAKAIRKGEWLK
ncbi:hypothetical protein JCM11641_002243 [Rhodosporidiobolus odoratus]